MTIRDQTMNIAAQIITRGIMVGTLHITKPTKTYQRHTEIDREIEQITEEGVIIHIPVVVVIELRVKLMTSLNKTLIIGNHFQWPAGPTVTLFQTLVYEKIHKDIKEGARAGNLVALRNRDRWQDQGVIVILRVVVEVEVGVVIQEIVSRGMKIGSQIHQGGQGVKKVTGKVGIRRIHKAAQGQQNMLDYVLKTWHQDQQVCKKKVVVCFL